MEINTGWHILLEDPEGNIIESFDIETYDLNKGTHAATLCQDIQEAIDNSGITFRTNRQ